MAVSLPNGSTYSLATAYAAALNVTAASNASECVLTVNNTLVAGDIVEFVSGWTKACRLFRVKTPTASNLVLEGLDTSDTSRFLAGSGTGTIRKITGWTQLAQVFGASASGGDQQFETIDFLEDDESSQLPTTLSPRTISLTLGDDPALPTYAALKAASEKRTLTGLMLKLPVGAIYYNGYVGFDDNPTQEKNKAMTVRATFAIRGKFTRYAS